MENFSIAVFADKKVGKKTVEYLLENYFSYIKYLVLIDKDSEIFSLALDAGFNKNFIFFSKDLYSEKVINKIKKMNINYILLAWWPFLMKEPIFSLPQKGILNFHPSFLPYNRGKHYNFWTIVEETPFGVSIHFAEESVDSGDIIFQKEINKTWEDNGKTLYEKAEQTMFELFIESYPKIIKSEYVRIKQSKKQGSFHLAKELEPASQIFLAKEYKARDLLNLLRARTFFPHPACYFFDKDKKYEVRVEIKEVER